jgi:hypothetical protein
MMKLRVLIAVATVALGALAADPAAMAGTLTSTQIYRAFTPSGAPAIAVTNTIQGHCFRGSVWANRNDAWRCTSDNLLYDPCFSSSKAKGIVLCPEAAWKRSGVEIVLTGGLPTQFGNWRAPTTDVRPWGVQIMSGAKCMLEGTGPIINPKVVGRYACMNGQWLWNQPNRTLQPWKIRIAPVTATKLTRRTGIAVAWF